VTVPYSVAARPFRSLSWFTTTTPVAPVVVSFRIDESGRPLGISISGSGYRPDASDIGPMLAASRFPPGAKRPACKVTFTLVQTPLDEAPLAELRAFAIAPNMRPDPSLIARTFPADNDCFAPSPAVRLRAFPPFKALPGTPGQIEWSMAGFDIDASGQPVDVTIVDGTGSPALDAATLAAVRETRYEPGAHHGCVYPYYRAPMTIVAPPPPDPKAFRSPDASCPAESDWVKKPSLNFPAAYDRRKIEGWAIIGFDVAPWGATGDIKVLAAEPTADFGDSARAIIRAATKEASPTGYTGCVERVVFRVPKDDDPAKPSVTVGN
jgi:TonB family protein